MRTRETTQFGLEELILRTQQVAETHAADRTIVIMSPAAHHPPLVGDCCRTRVRLVPEMMAYEAPHRRCMEHLDAYHGVADLQGIPLLYLIHVLNGNFKNPGSPAIS